MDSSQIDFSQADDVTLLKEIKAGNVQAFNELFRIYNRFLKIEAFYRLGDTHLAEEAVQDVFVSFWNRRQKIEIDVPIKWYLFGAIRKRCICLDRDLKLYKDAVKYKDEIDTEHGFDPHTLENKELFLKILRAIAHISAPSGRVAFEMHYLDRKPQKQIAQEMNLTLDAVKKKISRALQQVRDYLRNDS